MNTSGTKLDAAEPQARWAEYDANIIRSLYILASQKFSFQSNKMSNLSRQPLSSIHFHPPCYLSTMTLAQAQPDPPPAAPLSPAQPPAVQAPAPSAPSVPAVVPQPPLLVFIPADAPPDATHSTPIVQTFDICEEVKSNRLSRRVVFQSVQRCTFRARRFGHTSCVVPGFYWQLPPCM